MSFMSNFGQATSSFLLVTGEDSVLSTPSYTIAQFAGKNGSPARILIDSNNSSSTFGSSFRGRRTRGTSLEPLAISGSDVILQIVGDAWDGVQMSNAGISMVFFASENWTTSSNGTHIVFRTTTKGTVGSIERLRIRDDGNIFLSGSITASLFIGNLQGNSTSASYVLSASYAPGNPTISSSYAVTSSYAITNIITQTLNNNTTTSFYDQPHSIYNGVFINYVLMDGSNFRAGNIVVVYNTSSVKFNETCTTDIGNNDGLNISASISASRIVLSAANSNGNSYTMKYSVASM